MIGDLERATFSNIESQNISFAVHTIRPWLVRIEQAMDRALFRRRRRAVLCALQPGRPDARRLQIQDGGLRHRAAERLDVANDIRELENLNPLTDGEGGNLYLVNGNMIPITMTAAGTGKEGADAQAIDAGKPV